MNQVPKDVYQRLQELNDLRWWVRRLSIGCVILSLGVIAMAVALQASEGGAVWSVVNQAYERGLGEGTVMKNDELHKSFLSGWDAHKALKGTPVAPSGRGPLDLTQFTPEQANRLRCYLQGPPEAIVR